MRDWDWVIVAGCAVALMCWFLASPGARIRQRLRQNRLSDAYRIGARSGRRNQVRAHLERGLDLPVEVLREPVLKLYDHLVNLDRSATDPRNRFVDPDFLKTVREEVGRAFQALWETCLNLEIVGAQNVRFDPGHEKVREISARLESLSEASEVARVKLAELSLGAGRENAEEAELALRVVGRQAEALLSLESI